MNSVTAQAAELKLALEQLYKQAEEAPAKEKPKYSYKPEGKAKKEDKSKRDNEILSGGAARVLDYIPNTWGMARAGKATTLAKGMGQEVDPSVSHPNSSIILKTLKGLGLGTVGGGLAGAGIGALVGGIRDDAGSLGTRIGRGALAGGVGGSFFGGLGGAAKGLVGDAINRGNNVGRIRNDYNAARDAGQEMDLNAANPDLSRWGALLPFGGHHRAGSVDALEQLAGRPARSGGIRGAGRVGALGFGLAAPRLMGDLGSGLGLGLSTLEGGMEGYGAAVRNQKLISELEKGGSAAFAARLGRQNGTMHKRAFLESLKGMGTQALNAYKGLDPTAQAAILGGGAGAAIGGVGNALFGNKKKGLLSRLVMGALAGGGVGALGGAGVNEAVLRSRMSDNSPYMTVPRSMGMNPDRKSIVGLSKVTNSLGAPPLPAQMANNFIGNLMTPR